jgi:hypothetical protein
VKRKQAQNLENSINMQKDSALDDYSSNQAVYVYYSQASSGASALGQGMQNLEFTWSSFECRNPEQKGLVD